jgi:plastocyanin
MSTQGSQDARGSLAVGAIVAILIIAAVATLGYYQFEVANSTSTTTTTSTASVTCPSAACANVNITAGAGIAPPGYTAGEKTTFGFSPDTVVVVIGVNNTVYWTNEDAGAHTVTSDTAGLFDSGTSGPLTTQGGTFQFTFTTPGTYTYHCSFHSWMQGTVIVKASTGSSSTTTGSTTSTAAQSSATQTSTTST